MSSAPVSTSSPAEAVAEADGALGPPISEARSSWWLGCLGDIAAALAVMLGGGIFGGGLLRGPAILSAYAPPPGIGPSPDMPGEALLPEVPLYLHLSAIALLVLPAALMLLRRRLPVPVFAAAFALFSLTVLLGLPSIGPGIATMIAAYAFAYRVPRKAVLVTAASATAIALLLAFAVTGWESLDPRTFQLGAAFAIAAALGDSARSRREYLLATEDRARRAEQTREAEAQKRVSEERLRIARDLHDTVAHQVSVINLQAGAASEYLDSRPERAQQALGTIREAARGALGEIGELLRYLRDDEGAAAVPAQQGLEGLGALLERLRATGLEIDADIRGDLAGVTGSASTVAFRVIQEGLTNAHKHGSGPTVRLRVDAGADRLALEMDNPVAREASPIDGGGPEPGSGLGLVGIRERVAVMHGTVVAVEQGDRFRLEVVLPLHPEEAFA